MNRGISFAIAGILGFAPACVLDRSDQGWDDSEAEDSAAAEADDGPGLMPFHVATFDHHPTDAELEGVLAELDAKDGVQGVQYPTRQPPPRVSPGGGPCGRA